MSAPSGAEPVLSAGFPEEAMEALDPPSQVPGGYVTARFLLDELRRRRLLITLAGLLAVAAAVSLQVAMPSPYAASTQVLLTHEPGSDPQRGAATDARMAESRTVAGDAAQVLGIPVDDLLDTYQVEAVTDRVLQVSLTADTRDAAVARADAVAEAFLAFRAEQVSAREALVTEDLETRIETFRTQAADLASRVAGAVREDPAGQAELISELEDQRAAALSEVAALEQGVRDRRLATLTMNGGTRVLDAAATVNASRARELAVDALSALLAGLGLGAAFVVVRALLSDRVRRRADVAAALGAPVRLSVGPLRTPWWRRLTPRGARRRQASPEVLVERHLGRVLETRSTLAVVAADDVAGPAKVLVSLARSLNRSGTRVVLADLSGRGLLGRELAAQGSGRQEIVVEGGDTPLTLLSPGPEDGPLELEPPTDHTDGDRDRSPSAWARTSRLLVLAVVDPAVGADHLSAWTGSAVAMVTAGRSSATKLHTVGELVRLAGVDLEQVVLVSADSTDESIGIPRAEQDRTPEQPDGPLRDLGAVNP